MLTTLKQIGLAALALGVLLTGRTAFALNPPTANPITIDGQFTNPAEWSDVTPTTASDEPASIDFTYFTVEQTLSSAALFYDPGTSTAHITGPNQLVGTVSFDVGANAFTVEFVTDQAGNPSLFCFKNGTTLANAFNCSSSGIVGATTFGTSRKNPVTLHNMFELRVGFDCMDPTLHCPPTGPGVYSPDPSHWTAGFATSSQPSTGCVARLGTTCGGSVPTPVSCDTPGAVSLPGKFITNNCVNVVRGQAGNSVVSAGAVNTVVPAMPTTYVLGLFGLMLASGFFVFRRQRQASA